MPLSRKQTKRSKRSKKQQGRRRRLYKGGATATTLEDALHKAQVVLSSRQTNADYNPYDPSRKQLLEEAKREVQRIQWELNQARRGILGAPAALAPAPAPAPAYQQYQQQPMAPQIRPTRPPPLAPAPVLYQQQQQPMIAQLAAKNNYNRLAANQKTAANAAINSLKLLEKRATEEVQRLTFDLEKKRVAATQVPTNINRLWASEAQRNLEAAKAQLQRIKNAQLNPTGSNALLLLATTMKSQNNVRGRLTAAALLNKKVPKKNLMSYTMKDLLTYLGS
jgi:hypothetical protein